jgi:hypothetical protein
VLMVKQDSWICTISRRCVQEATFWHLSIEMRRLDFIVLRIFDWNPFIYQFWDFWYIINGQFLTSRRNFNSSIFIVKQYSWTSLISPPRFNVINCQLFHILRAYRLDRGSTYCASTCARSCELLYQEDKMGKRRNELFTQVIGSSRSCTLISGNWRRDSERDLRTKQSWSLWRKTAPRSGRNSVICSRQSRKNGTSHR